MRGERQEEVGKREKEREKEMLHRMTPVYSAHAQVGFNVRGHSVHSRQTDRQTDGRTDTANVGRYRLHLMHSMQPTNGMSQ